MMRISIPRGRPAIVIPASFVAAFLAGFAAQRIAPEGWKDLAAIVAVWIAFYPIPRLKPKIPWWWHWVQGVFILLGAWFVLHS
jgi:hypothetical protein